MPSSTTEPFEITLQHVEPISIHQSWKALTPQLHAHSIFVVCGTHRIRLEFWMVDKRCAITSVVCCFISLSNASWTAASLSESRALVASA